MVSLLFVFTAFVISNIGHIRPQRTILAFVSGIFFILSGRNMCTTDSFKVLKFKAVKDILRPCTVSLVHTDLAVVHGNEVSKQSKTYKLYTLQAFLVTVCFHIFQLFCCVV